MNVEQEGEKTGLKINIQKAKIMANRQGKKMETMADFIFLGSKITADSDCIREIKRQLLLGRKVKTNLVY